MVLRRFHRGNDQWATASVAVSDLAGGSGSFGWLHQAVACTMLVKLRANLLDLSLERLLERREVVRAVPRIEDGKGDHRQAV